MAGGAWDKNDSHAATTMLPSLLMVYDVSQDSKWLDYYNQFLPGQIPYLDPQQKFEFHGHPLYIYQQMYKLIAFEQLAGKYDPDIVPSIRRGRKAWEILCRPRNGRGQKIWGNTQRMTSVN